MRFRILLFLGLLSLVVTSSPGWAADKRIYTRETTGVIRSINLSEREAIISGYKYYFGSPVYNDAADVDMYGSQYGSFEMLRVGMKVYIRYAEYGNIRYVVQLQQLSDTLTGVEN
ncbi:MAG: hypothetical protein HUJ31_07770 [Pseudomonadales bacterium]|nr:hypothetical protein [Pseudomonadales bacterium]